MKPYRQLGYHEGPGAMRDLHWGDNLDVLRKHIFDASVDLIYLDPPFNSNRNYNVLFRENGKHGTAESDAQIQAFTDTWHWTEQAEETYAYLVFDNAVPQRVSDLITAMRSFIGSNDVMAYLVMMTMRLLELHRVLKPTGSIYLHCDPTASHYLKVVMDTIWGPQNFANEIVWRRTTTKNDYKQGAVNWPRVHDTLLMYHQSTAHAREARRFAQPFAPYDDDYVATFYSFKDADGRRYRLSDLTAPGQGSRGHPQYEFLGVTRFWRYNQEKMQQLYAEGRIEFRPNGNVPRLKVYLDEAPGVAIGDVWTDIRGMINFGGEMLGYPTQKPEALLERIIRASSNPGDVVLDPFCGCGTAIAVAERLERQWVGIDITHLAIAAIKFRMETAFPGIEIELHGEPKDVGGARKLAEVDRYDFQNWAIGLVKAQPAAADAQGKSKKGADRGIDGVIRFEGNVRKVPGRCLVQVKSGHVSSATIRDLVGTVDREKADMGLLITLEEPTGPMRTEALSAGFYNWNFNQVHFPRIQILTIAELLANHKPQMPTSYHPYQLSQYRPRDAYQPSLLDQRAAADD